MIEFIRAVQGFGCVTGQVLPADYAFLEIAPTNPGRDNVQIDQSDIGI